MRYKQLPEHFIGKGEVRGYEFLLLSKTKQGFCYEVRSKDTFTHFEVFRLKINKRFNCESYPTSKAFGIWAWTYSNQNVALQKLYSIK